MLKVACPHCLKVMALDVSGGETLTCPYCARRFDVGAEASAPPAEAPPAPCAPPADSPLAQERVKAADSEEDVKRRYALLLEAEAAFPESLAVQKALLFHGRLHERGGKTLDFSVIKCFLFHAFLEPNTLRRGQREAMIAELFDDPRVARCMALSPDGDAFLRAYLQELARRYIALFLRGSTKYMRVILGFGSASKAPRYLADPAEDILRDMLAAPELPQDRRVTLARAFYRAFAEEMSGETQWLDARMGDALPILRAEDAQKGTAFAE